MRDHYQFLRGFAQFIVPSGIGRPYISVLLPVEKQDGKPVPPQSLSGICILHPEMSEKPAE
jgi:hypothetical protein